MADPKNKNGDMTRIEDLSQLLHRDDPEIEALFRKANELPDLPTENEESIEEEISFEESVNEEILNEEIQNEETPIEVTFEESAPNFEESDSFNNETETEIQQENLSPEIEEVIFESNNIESNNIESDSLESQNEESTFSNIETDSDYQLGESHNFLEDTNNTDFHEEKIETPSAEEEISLHQLQQENIEYNNATNFGHASIAANPAYSLKIENLDPKDADDILEIISEYGLLENNAEKDFRDSLKSGALLISQRSEYLIIHLATRLKRFGASMIMGPSDKIFSSKILKSQASRGLVTKKIKDQAKKGSEDFTSAEKNQRHQDFYLAFVGEPLTVSVFEDLGPLYATEIIDEDDLLRSSYAQRSLEKIEKIPAEELHLFKEYSELIDLKKIKLQKILKAKAIVIEANGIINMQFLLNTQSVKGKTLLILTAEGRAVKMQQNSNNEEHFSDMNEVKNEL